MLFIQKQISFYLKKKPSIFKETKKQIEEVGKKNLPVPKPSFQKKEIEKPKNEKKGEPKKIKVVEEQKIEKK